MFGCPRKCAPKPRARRFLAEFPQPVHEEREWSSCVDEDESISTADNCGSCRPAERELELEDRCTKCTSRGFCKSFVVAYCWPTETKNGVQGRYFPFPRERLIVLSSVPTPSFKITMLLPSSIMLLSFEFRS
jgi:hypothetical protein